MRNFLNLMESLSAIAEIYQMPIIVSTHPRTQKRIDAKKVQFHPMVRLLKPLGFKDYVKLQKEARAVLSDSGTATADATGDALSILGGTGVTTAVSADAVTITNSGVTSAVAGSGIDVSGATGAVTISIGTGEVVNAMIGDDEINSEHYAAASIDHEHLANDIIDGDNIQDDVINSEHYAAASIDNEHLADNAVDSAELAAGSVDDGHLSDGVATGLAGTGMTATSGVLNVIGGTGITANANEITTTDGDIVHDNLSGFVANEHIDHSGVTLTAGDGLTGGGTIASNRTFTVVGGNGITANSADIGV